jgi:hypothetical protein
MEPNLFGKVLFFTWPLVILWFFKKYTVKQAVLLAVVISSILLPYMYEFDLPLIPPLNRDTLTSLTLLLILFVKKQKNPLFKSGLWNSIFITYLIIVVISSLINSDELISGDVPLKASTPYDALSNVLLFILSFMPFIFGRNFFNNPKDTIPLFKTMTICAIIYSIPMLYEIRLSPQIHAIIFGYFPGDFIQQMRGDGFRPIVFIGHGLALAFWFVTCIIGALALFKSNLKVMRLFGLPLIIYLIVVLVLCKTVSVVLYLIFAVILIFILKEKRQLKYSLILALFVFIYPFNVATQVVKNSDVLEYVGEYSQDRADSLQTRLENEERLMERALERPFFGWAGWGRNRVYSWGKDITITDGMWIMAFGVYGALGFIFYYLMLIYPILKALKNHRYITDDNDKILFITLAIILAIGIFDSIPNAGMMPIHLLLAGALLGQAEFIVNQQKQLRKKPLRTITYATN